MTNLLKSNASAPSATNRLSFKISSTLRDTFAGTSTTELVWGPRINERSLGRTLASASRRQTVSAFFLKREIETVLLSMIPVPFFRPHETAFTKADLFTAVKKVVKDEVDASAIVELVLPPLLELGLVSSTIEYSVQTDYGFDDVTVEDIRVNIMVYQAAEAAKKISLKKFTRDRVSRNVFAEAVAKEFREIGHAVEEITDLSVVIEDMVLGVRAYIDPNFTIDPSSASVPADWRNHKIVEELAENEIFVTEALALPVGQRLRLNSDSYKLEKYAPVVMAAIKSSDRYEWVSRERALATYSMYKVRDIKGAPVCAVISRNVEVAPVAQAVFATKDVSMPSALNVSATRERLAEAIQIAYGKASFSLNEGAELLLANLKDYVEAGWTGRRAVYFCDTSTGATVDSFAKLLADVVHVEVVNGQVTVDPTVEAMVDKTSDEEAKRTIWKPKYWYTVNTTELNLSVWSGRHMGDQIITEDPSEVILAAPEREAKELFPARAQLLAPEAFNTRLLNLNENRIIDVSSRFSYNVNVLGISMRGNFKASDFASLRSGTYTALCKPFFNNEVITTLQNVFKLCADVDDIVSASGEEHWSGERIDSEAVNHVQKRYARYLLQLAQKLDPAFRHEVQQVIVERAVHSGGFTGAEADLYRARLSQKAFMAYSDVIALLFFLHVQGIEASVWHELASRAQMTRVCVEYGSDRKK